MKVVSSQWSAVSKSGFYFALCALLLARAFLLTRSSNEKRLDLVF
jgi:hypothetical protein